MQIKSVKLSTFNVSDFKVFHYHLLVLFSRKTIADVTPAEFEHFKFLD